VSVARRVASERNVTLGEQVGYAVRFEDLTSTKLTRIVYMTDGTLLRNVLEDPTLSRYGIIVLDEAHERSLNTDILFALLKSMTLNTTLKLVVTSATLDAEKFAAYFGGCPVLRVPGRTFPVDIVHSKEDYFTFGESNLSNNRYMEAAIETALDIHCNRPPGDILIFLTGSAEIEKAATALNDAVCALPAGSCPDLLVLPLYAALPPDMQARIFQPAPTTDTRRCIIATNVAETSVTVDGVVYVVDSGVVKLKGHDPATSMDSLGVAPISRVQAAQRAGRAGRTRAGVCFRLYTKETYEQRMQETTPPEILRTSLTGTVLYLKSLFSDTKNILDFDFLDSPDPSALEAALHQLYVLGAIDSEGGKITPIGRAMATLPLDPCFARAVVEAGASNDDPLLVDDIIIIAAMFAHEKGPFRGDVQPKALELAQDGCGDHILYLRLYKEWQSTGYSTQWCYDMGLDTRVMRFARDVHRQLARSVHAGEDFAAMLPTSKPSKRRRGVCEDRRPSRSIRSIQRALAVGFAPRLARRMTMHNGYRPLMNPHGTMAQAHPNGAALAVDDDGLLPEYIVYNEMVGTGSHGRVFLRGCCPVSDVSWVRRCLLPRLTSQVDLRSLAGPRVDDGVTVNDGRLENKDGASLEVTVDKPEKLEADISLEEKKKAARERYLARKAAGCKRTVSKKT
jgi:ATP-dependent RNA helicase DHX8/PRP22